MRIHHPVILDKLGDGTLYPGDGYSGGQITLAGQAKERQQSIALGYQDVIRHDLLLKLEARISSNCGDVEFQIMGFELAALPR
jgi:hypothetical protein